METTPRFDVSRPSNVRLAAFALTAIGALAMGVAAFLTWVTYGITAPGDVPTNVPGTDDAAGRIVLIASVAILFLAIASRFAKSRRRATLAWAITVAALIGGAASVWFIVNAEDRYSAIAPAIAELTTVRAYLDVASGPWIAFGGSVVALVGGVLTVRWAGRVSEPTVLPPH